MTVEQINAAWASIAQEGIANKETKAEVRTLGQMVGRTELVANGMEIFQASVLTLPIGQAVQQLLQGMVLAGIKVGMNLAETEKLERMAIQ